MPYRMKSDFEPHPVGQFDGIIYLWKDRGLMKDSYGNEKHKAMMGIESLIAKTQKGDPFTIVEPVNLAFGPKSKLQTRREQILGRPLKPEEVAAFEPSEILHARVGYTVKHNPKPDGGVWCNIDALWRLEDQLRGELVNAISCNINPELYDSPSSQTELLYRAFDLLTIIIDDTGDRIFNEARKAQAHSILPDMDKDKLIKVIKNFEAIMEKEGIVDPSTASPSGKDLPF